MHAFVAGGALPLRRDAGACLVRRGARQHSTTQHRRTRIGMMLDPSGRIVPRTPAQIGPERYKPLEGWPGTFPPGTEGDNFPLQDIMHVAEDVVYQELDMDEATPDIFPLQEDLLEYFDKIDRLMPRSQMDDELEEELKKQMSGITEEDLEYADSGEEEVMTYFSRSDNPASLEGYNYDDMY